MSAVSPELNAEAAITEHLDGTWSYSRDFSETDFIGALVDELSATEFAVVFSPDGGLGGRFGVEQQRTREIGTGILTADLYIEAATTYRLSERVLLELGLDHLRSRGSDHFDYDRTVLQFGGDITF